MSMNTNAPSRSENNVKIGTLIVSCLTFLMLGFNTIYDVQLKRLNSEKMEIEIKNSKPEFKVEYVTLSEDARDVFKDPHLLNEIGYAPLHHDFVWIDEISKMIDDLYKQYQQEQIDYTKEKFGFSPDNVIEDGDFGLTCLIIEQIGIGNAQDVKLTVERKDLNVTSYSIGNNESIRKNGITIALGSLGRNDGRVIPLYINEGRIDNPEAKLGNFAFLPIKLTYTDIDNIIKTYPIREESYYKIYIGPNLYSGQ
jgi:hypothetical protein